ncbi:MAG TPA: hypothetical protein IGS53_06225 [Leptolyngbyaceae cyanobacterium M33_DOE_097]|nr:hypothetical protein [Leptolyngbyaceae cyanobacterium M33_DOE_097]
MASNTSSQSDHSEIYYSDWANGYLKDEWRVSKNSLYARQMAVDHLVMPGSTIDFPPLIEHLIVMALTQQSRQVNQFDGGEYDGMESIDEFFPVLYVCRLLISATSWN